MEKYDWNALKTEFITGEMSVSALARKHNISYSTLLYRYRTENWNELKKEYRNSVFEKCADNAAYIAAITLTKELDIANRLSEVLFDASMDEKQFNRYLVKGKDFTEEVILDKLDIDSLNGAIKALKSLEEIKMVMNDVVNQKKENEKELNQETGVVILPDIEEEEYENQ